MPFKLFHGDSIDDSAPWCPVCFDLDYQNLNTFGIKVNKADPGNERKGALRGFHLWWRGRPDFQQRAEQSACVFCAVLIQVVDRFWKQPAPRQLNDRFPVYKLNVFNDGSVEVISMRDCPRRPLGLLLYTPSGHPPAWGRLPPAPEISPSGNSKRALQYFRRQLKICSENHEECSHDSPVLPTRVLDVRSLEIEQEVKLFEPAPGTTGKYVALSYCWGDGNALQATRSNLSKLLQGVEEDELPATIRDAVELTRYIGIRYLWVDALCIIQDDTQDWVHESAQMSAVYAQAFLTISASSVSSSRASFLHQSRGNKEVLLHWQSPETATKAQDAGDDVDALPLRGGMLAVRRSTLSGFHQNTHDDIIDPTMTRAWTLQEHALSTRLVCFSTDEIQWTCRTLRACECGNPEQHESPRLEQLQRDLLLAGPNRIMEPVQDEFRKRRWKVTLVHFWTDLVLAYCRRNLSCARDKLPALSGVAHEFSQTFNESRLADMVEVPPLGYLAGLWNFELLFMLLWSKGHSSQFFPEYRAPSWSWASIEGRIQTIPLFPGLRPQAEVLTAVCTPANSEDPFGQVVREGTYLRLRATVLETKMWLHQRAPSWAAEHTTPYGWVITDGILEEVPLDEAVWGKSSASAATASAAVDGKMAVTSELVQTRTLQRLRRTPQRSAYAADRKRIKRMISVSESETGSDEDSDSGSDEESASVLDEDSDTSSANYGRNVWEGPELGRQFTVWLLHVADDGPGGKGQRTHLLVLGRPAGGEQVYERLGYMNVWHERKWAKDIAGQAMSVVTIV